MKRAISEYFNELGSQVRTLGVKVSSRIINVGKKSLLSSVTGRLNTYVLFSKNSQVIGDLYTSKSGVKELRMNPVLRPV